MYEIGEKEMALDSDQSDCGSWFRQLWQAVCNSQSHLNISDLLHLQLLNGNNNNFYFIRLLWETIGFHSAKH